MPQEYTSEQIWKLYENLPEEIKEALFSFETAEAINNTCRKYGITDERVGKISDTTGQVLAGLLLPSELPKAIKKETNLPEVLVRAITQEINRFIFYPVKPALEQLYKMEITSTGEPAGRKEEMPAEEKPAAPAGKDTYREPIE